MALRGLRGATCLHRDNAVEMTEAVSELITQMLGRNGLTGDDVVSVVLTATPDLHCAFPAAAARLAGLDDVPLLCAVEMDVVGALPKVVRVLMHIDFEGPKAALRHVYLRGAEVLRVDLIPIDSADPTPQ